MSQLSELLKSIWTLEDIDKDWESIKELRESMELPEFTGGVNPGDQRAIYYLARGFELNNILEIGTHLGCSTTHLALAIKDNPNAKITTVDIRDVNDTETDHSEHYIPHDFRGKNFSQFKSKYTPKECLEVLDLDDKVEFVMGDSVNFLMNTEETYDLIFLDGNHDFDVVLGEVPLAMKKLNQGGIILLHDYFPDCQPLWPKSSDVVCTGPFMAIKYLQRNYTKIHVEPCGELPWEVKYEGEHATSLAVGVLYE